MQERNYNSLPAVKINDVVGRLSIPNSNLDLDIVQGTDNSYYLNHNLDGEYSAQGIPFLDYRINMNSKKIIIYGHNSKVHDVPFNNLNNYYDYNYIKNHEYINFDTTVDNRIYKIFSVFVETSDWSYTKLNFNRKEEWHNHLINLKKKSIYDIDENVEDDDEILILQTCCEKEEYKDFKRKYLLIIARRIK